jgi:hypothetical protein
LAIALSAVPETAAAAAPCMKRRREVGMAAYRNVARPYEHINFAIQNTLSYIVG